MKICFVSPYTARGGAELSLMELIDALQPRGFECSCIVPADGAISDLLAQRGIAPIVVRFKPWVHVRKKSILERVAKMSPHRQIFGAARLVSAMKRSGCDLVYTNSVAAGAGAIASKVVGKPHLWHLREFGHDDYQLTFDIGRKLSMFLMRRCSSSFIANSKAVAEAFGHDLGESALNVIYNAVELPTPGDGSLRSDADSPWRHRGAIRCILVGKCFAGKGQEDAVCAMLHLRRWNVPAELLLVGETLNHAYHQQILDLVQQHDLADRVHFLGHTDDPASWMRSADVVLMCSRREAFGRVTVEGMKLGKPVIGTRSGGTPEIIEQGRTGLLYRSGDAAELARNIVTLYESPSLRNQIGMAARQSAQTRFNIDKFGDNIAMLIRRVVNAHHARKFAPAPSYAGGLFARPDAKPALNSASKLQAHSRTHSHAIREVATASSARHLA